MDTGASTMSASAVAVPAANDNSEVQPSRPRSVAPRPLQQPRAAAARARRCAAASSREAQRAGARRAL
jgi:hypothetical protein